MIDSHRRRIVVGTTNRGKLREIQEVLAGFPVDWRCLADYPEAVPPEETGTTFAQNARLKAVGLAQQLGEWVLADDSGLCVDALDGRPGIRSARYAGDDATDERNVARLLDELRDVPDADRGAAFRCAIALAAPQGVLLEAEGTCAGTIAREPHGCNGFGYDPVFYYADFGATFAQVVPERKNAVSHRARALGLVAESLPTLLAESAPECAGVRVMAKCYVGIDLGGTNIKGGVVDSTGTVRHFQSIETEGAQGRDHVLDRIALLVDLVRDGAGLAKDEIVAVGIGSPGPLDTTRGYIHTAPNLPGWENLPLADEVSRRCGYPVFIENDANAAALAESFAGAGKGMHCMLMLTLGTGIGGGIVIDGRVWHGANDCAGELGHVSIDYKGRPCNCGSIGCVETYASASNLVARTRETLAAGETSSLSQYGDALECHHIFQAAAEGDACAQQVVDEGLVMLSAAIASFINIFNPDMIVLFGGMTKAGEQLFGPVREEAARRAFPTAFERCQIVPAQLGEEAGVIGSAVSAMQRMGDA